MANQLNDGNIQANKIWSPTPPKTFEWKKGEMRDKDKFGYSEWINSITVYTWGENRVRTSDIFLNNGRPILRKVATASTTNY